MKSTPDDLAKRGFIEEDYEKHFENHTIVEILELLVSRNPKERTVAAKLLGKRKNKTTISPLCNALRIEKKLYSKIAISEALGKIGIDALPNLIELLGKIDCKQHKKLPSKPFKKKNYPLPRDIAARTIIKMGKEALPYLEKFILSGEQFQVSEAIDAIGYITYYTKDLRSLNNLKKCLKKYQDIRLIQWKIIRAYESFPTEDVINYLNQVLKTESDNTLFWEAKRSLEQIKRVEN